MSKLYYCVEADGTGEALGPYTVYEINTLRLNGGLTDQHLAAGEGDSGWLSLHQLFGPVSRPKPQISPQPFLGDLSRQASLRSEASDTVARISPARQPNCEHIDTPAPKITGWLALLGVGVCLSPFLQVFSILKEFLDINKALGEVTFSDLKFGFQTIIMFEVIGCVLLVALAAWRAWLFWCKRRAFKGFNVAWFAGVMVFNLLLLFFGNMLGIKYDAEFSNEVARSVLFAAIWIPYTLKSKQVATVFIR